MSSWFKKLVDKMNLYPDEATISPSVTSDSQNEDQPVTLKEMLFLEKSEKWSEVIAKCQVWLDQQPSNPLPYFCSGNAHLKIGKPVAAVAMYRKALEISKKDQGELPTESFPIARCWYGLGHAHVQLKERQDAVYAFMEAAIRDPGVPDIWNDLGVVYLSLEPYDTSKAFDAFKKAIEVDSKNLQSITNIGFVYAICDMEPQVNMIYQELIALDKTQAQSFLKKANDKLREVRQRSR